MDGKGLAELLLADKANFAPVVVLVDGRWHDVVGVERKDYVGDYYVALTFVLGPPRGESDGSCGRFPASLPLLKWWRSLFVNNKENLMKWLNASGSPVAMNKISIQIDLDVPTEEVTSITSPNWFAVLKAAAQLYVAWMTGNPAAIAAAIQAFFAALTGG